LKCTAVRFVRLPRGGTISTSELALTESDFSERKPLREGGIEPEMRFVVSDKISSLVSLARLLGINPLIRLLPNERIVNLTSAPSVLGIVPDIEFCDNITAVRAVRLPNDEEIDPIIDCDDKSMRATTELEQDIPVHAHLRLSNAQSQPFNAKLVATIKSHNAFPSTLE
jgi:hypothetical protein